MKPTYAIYVLESRWCWDHANTEIATITIEGREGHRDEPDFEQVVDPACPPSQRESFLQELKAIAKAQNRCPMNRAPDLVRLYRVTDFDGILRGCPQIGETPKLNLTMKLVCEFNREGNPVVPES